MLCKRRLDQVLEVRVRRREAEPNEAKLSGRRQQVRGILPNALAARGPFGPGRQSKAEPFNRAMKLDQWAAGRPRLTESTRPFVKVELSMKRLVQVLNASLKHHIVVECDNCIAGTRLRDRKEVQAPYHAAIICNSDLLGRL